MMSHKYVYLASPLLFLFELLFLFMSLSSLPYISFTTWNSPGYCSHIAHAFCLILFLYHLFFFFNSSNTYFLLSLYFYIQFKLPLMSSLCYFPMQEGAFAQLKIWQCATIAIVFFFAPLISFKAVVVIMLAFLCLSFCIFLFLALKVGKASLPPTSQ